MATSINAYKTSSYLDAYSKDGANDDPVFPYPPNDFDGDAGQSRDIELFIRNDGTTFLRNNTIFPYDLGAGGKQLWVKLAATQVGLDSAPAGGAISFVDLDPGDTTSVWERMTVPPSTPLENVTDVTVRIQSQVYDV